MVDCLLDTNVVVDLYHGYEPARAWITTQNAPGITRAVVLEVLEGVQDNPSLRQTLKLLDDFELMELTVSDFDWATRQLIKYRLSHNIDAFDCLIAAPSYRLQLPLYTRNLRHFAPLLGKLAQEPYA
jgi:predicted nucleic acid-binding protein